MSAALKHIVPVEPDSLERNLRWSWWRETACRVDGPLMTLCYKCRCKLWTYYSHPNDHFRNPYCRACFDTSFKENCDGH